MNDWLHPYDEGYPHEEVMNEPLLTARQVARLLAIHPNTVKRIDRAELPYLRLFSRGDRRFRREDVEAYLKRKSEA